ncbi:MAG: cysteine desulfurase family protein [Planctomycetota bacterium]|nr:cysteine desulfurase family protein [Planctomycetota bacterium]
MSIYLDNNATTPPAPEVIECMRRCLEDDWGNPSSAHRTGIAARRRVDLARNSVASLLGCETREIIFTSGGTEAANLGIRGAFQRIRERSPRRTLLACAETEHPAVLDSIRRLVGAGGEVVILPVDPDGLIDLGFLDRLLAADGDRLALCSVMWANNETGVVQPISEIGSRCREHDVLFHTDAVQWVGRESTSFRDLPIDLLSCSAHKFHGPKGAGALVVRRGIAIEPFQFGGPQERERRGGTENVAAIAGFGVACDLAADWLEQRDHPGLLKRRNHFEAGLLALDDSAVINGAGVERLWNTTNIAFPGLQAQMLVVILSERGLAVSGGAACASGSIEVSGVLGAMGLDSTRAAGSLRLSFSRYTSEAELEQSIAIFESVLASCR